MKLFTKAPDGGANSGVTGYFLIEWKRFFSIALLHFSSGSREAFHSHAFNAYTIWLKGLVVEEQVCGEQKIYKVGDFKYTPKTRFHRIVSFGPSWALTFRGPWDDTWQEYKDGEITTLTHGRKVVRVNR